MIEFDINFLIFTIILPIFVQTLFLFTGSNNQQEMQKGIVTILDVLQVCNSTDQDEVNLNDKMAGVIGELHF